MSSIITRIFTSKGRSRRVRSDVIKEAKGTAKGLLVLKMEGGHEPRKCEQPQNLEKARKWILLYNLQKERHLDFSPVELISNF